MKHPAVVAVGLLVSAIAEVAGAATCTVAATNVAFGAYNRLSPTPLDAAGNIQVTCSGLAGLLINYQIQLSPGGSGSYSPRAMVSGPGSLAYNLYTNAARTSIWGNGSGGTVTVNDGVLLQLLSPIVRNYPLYGRVPASQNVPAGAYSDTITVTVIY